MIQGYQEFEFQLPEALLTQIVGQFAEMSSGVLVPQNVVGMPDAQGVYQLLHKGELVYIGKTDAEAGLRARLERHSRNVQHRLNMNAEDVEFKAIRVFVFTAMDLESQLIAHYGRDATGWNGSGFGANDPGRERDTTRARDNHFDVVYPLDLDRPLSIDLASCQTVGDGLARVKNAVPYTFRFELETGRRRAHPELAAASVPTMAGPITMRSFLTAVAAALPAGWQATSLPGRVILYKESRQYPHGSIIARS